MKAYLIRYSLKSNPYYDYNKGIDAKDIKSAKRKIERIEKGKIIIHEVKVIGYY